MEETNQESEVSEEVVVTDIKKDDESDVEDDVVYEINSEGEIVEGLRILLVLSTYGPFGSSRLPIRRNILL
jgi:hypothetical protein